MAGERKGKCRACPAEMIWATMCEPDGTVRRKGNKPILNPLDTDALDPADVTPATHAIAYNPGTGHAVAVTNDTIEQMPAWVAAGATLHLSHFATCPNRRQFRRD